MISKDKNDKIDIESCGQVNDELTRREKREELIIKAGAALASLMFLLIWLQLRNAEIAVAAAGSVLVVLVLLQIVFKQRRAARLRRSGILDIDKMDDRQFERYLAQLFRSQGYSVDVTPRTGDIGADVILSKDGSKIAVQAKHHSQSAEISAVQEVLASKSRYGADEAWVVSNDEFSPAAAELARSNGVRLIGRDALIDMILSMHPDAAAPK